MARRRKTGLCACGSRQAYQQCCGRFISGELLPETCGELMRSRFTAYAIGDADYIIATTDPEGDAWEEDEVEWRDSIAQFARRCTFRKVELREESQDGDTGQVEFRADVWRAKVDASFAEVSEFVRREGRWLYTSGESLRGKE